MFGLIKFLGQEWPEIAFDRLSTDQNGNLTFLSVVADAGLIKGIRGILNTGNTSAEMVARGVDLERAGEVRQAGKIRRTPGGYYDDCFRLAYNHVHAFFWVKNPLFMMSVNDAHLWAKLKTADFTTPLIPEWLPFVREGLIASGKLVRAFNYRCECGGMLATTEDLDVIVQEGLRSRKLLVPVKSVA